MENITEDQLNLMVLVNLTARIGELENRLTEATGAAADNNNAFFMLSMALIIFLMQCGFAFLEAGAVRSKNTTNILMTNVCDSLIAIIGYWSVGWALAYGPNSSVLAPFVGGSQFFMSESANLAKFFFQYVFAATAATITSGAVAERCDFVAFMVYSIYIASVVYPILTHWGWSEQGWMAHGYTLGEARISYVDFAGSGLVHLCGGTISLIAAVMMGPRIGRFAPGAGGIKGHSVPLVCLGGFILMFGFLAFNGGSTSDISTPNIGQSVARAMTNTIMSGSFAALVFMFIYFARKRKWSVLLTINACLTGMVSACAGCNNAEIWSSCVTGAGAGIAYMVLSEAAIWFKVDDPLDAFAVHAGGGMWGLFSVCFVGSDGLVFAVFGDETDLARAGAQLVWNMLCALAIIVFSTVTIVPVFAFLKCIGRFRVSEEIELKGLDVALHGEPSYPIAAYGHGWVDFESYKETMANGDILRKNGGYPEMYFGDCTVQTESDNAYLYQDVPHLPRLSNGQAVGVYHRPPFYLHPRRYQKSGRRQRRLRNNDDLVAPGLLHLQFPAVGDWNFQYRF